jgi:hypothetical protein
LFFNKRVEWRKFNKNKKTFKLVCSTKSQAHQPPQFNSCCAHQPPVNSKDIDNINNILVMFCLYGYNFLYFNFKLNLNLNLCVTCIYNTVINVINISGCKKNNPFNRLVLIGINIGVPLKKQLNTSFSNKIEIIINFKKTILSLK